MSLQPWQAVAVLVFAGIVVEETELLVLVGRREAAKEVAAVT